MITPDLINNTPGMWYIDAKLFDSDWEPGLTLKFTSFTGKCLYWHTVKKKWSTEGCQVGEKSTPVQTQCLCNHLTLFGSSFFVMPNNVDISRTAELFATVKDNYVVLALLCAFFGLYLITLLWACYADRRARSKRKMTLLEDNHPGAQYNYLIGIQTGHRKNAGTSANVTVKLIGSEGESSVHLLADPDKTVFERGSFDMFLVATPFPLGDVGNLRLQHDNSGGHPSWYVDKVTIQDVQTKNVWHFFCDCWMSADRGDGITKKTFNAAKSNEIASFRNIFQSRTSTGFRDEHIWVSIVSPPSRSPFTRAQRVSCCMSLLLCTMAINIAFWNLPVDESSPVIFSMGSMNITWQEIMVGVQSGLLMFPINILIITIFRSIRPRMPAKSKKDNAENMRPHFVTMHAILKETEEVIFLVSQSRRNKMSNVSQLETTADLWPALDKVHEFLQLMQGESESDPHWVHCSKFLLVGLSRLLTCLGRLDPNSFPNPYDHQQALNITNTLVRKAEMVFSSHLAYCPPPVKTEKKRTRGCWLPWWFVFIGWFLLLSISGISTFFTLLYGFEYGKEKSIKWVMSLGLSLFQSIFILQPLKVLGIAVIFALMLKPVAVEETEEIELVLIEQQEKCRRWAGRDGL
ncbi:polycystic kidney disease protein 1-like 2 [Mugil cephalus]|uniref:polycystic kidney disease protein 1-like 2 n=1 Tax=Mugil cephalus TaxID=48193 RepID=UPI001FB6B529|nr:polycystic kidney disease protein 1-like 2 [Mugil cephalus]